MKRLCSLFLLLCLHAATGATQPAPTIIDRLGTPGCLLLNDSARNRLYAASCRRVGDETGRLIVLNATTHVTLATIDLGGVPSQAVLDRRSARIYTAVNGTLLAIDTRTARISARLERIGLSRVRDMQLSARGDRLYVAGYDPDLPGNERVWVIDTESFQAIHTLAFDGPPTELELADQDRILLVAGERPGVVPIETASFARLQRIRTLYRIEYLHSFRGLDVILGVRDNERATCLFTWDATAATCRRLPGRYLDSEFNQAIGLISILIEPASGDGHRILHVDPTDGTITATWDVPASSALAVNPRTERLYLATEGSIEVRRAADGDVELTIPAPGNTTRIIKDLRRDRYYLPSSPETHTLALEINLNAAALVDDPATTTVEQAETFSTSVALIDRGGQLRVTNFTFTPVDSTVPADGSLDTWSYVVTVPGGDVEGGTQGTSAVIATGWIDFDANGQLTTPAGDVFIRCPRWSNGTPGHTLRWSLHDTAGQARLSGWAAPSVHRATYRQDSIGLTVLSGWEALSPRRLPRDSATRPFVRQWK